MHDLRACQDPRYGWYSPGHLPDRPLRRLLERSNGTFLLLRRHSRFIADGRTPYVMRFHARFDGAVWPSGAATLRMPISQKDLDRLHQFREKILAGIFSQGTTCTREVGRTRDLLIADWEDLRRTSQKFMSKVPEKHTSKFAKEFFSKKKKNMCRRIHHTRVTRRASSTPSTTPARR